MYTQPPHISTLVDASIDSPPKPKILYETLTIYNFLFLVTCLCVSLRRRQSLLFCGVDTKPASVIGLEISFMDGIELECVRSEILHMFCLHCTHSLFRALI